MHSPEIHIMTALKLKSVLVLLLGMTFLALPSCSQSGKDKAPESYRFYVGSGDWNLNKPIFLCELDPATQAITVLDSFPAEGGAGYLTLSPDGQYLYATSGKSVPDDEGNNSVAAYRIGADLSLELINRQSSQGRGNCHVSTSPDGSYVFAANYSSGHATALPVDEKGMLSEASSVVKGEGSGPNTRRQEGPHAHQVVMDPSGKYLLVPDLGTDKIMNYVLDPESGELTPNPEQIFLMMEPGSGPRHLAFHPTGKYVYILGELKSTLTACAYDAKSGKLTPINTASIVDEGFDGNRQAAAVRVHPKGKFIYATNRDDVSNLAVFKREENGSITQIQLVQDVAHWPRDFNITPDGRYLVLAGARANTLECYVINPNTGQLTATDTRTALPGPISVVFIPRL